MVLCNESYCFSVITFVVGFVWLVGLGCFVIFVWVLIGFDVCCVVVVFVCFVCGFYCVCWFVVLMVLRGFGVLGFVLGGGYVWLY